MSHLTAGWLTGNPEASTLDFIPHPRFSTRAMPGTLPVTLGPDLRKTVRIGKSRLERSSPRMLPARLMKTSGGEWKAGPFIAILTSEGPRSFRGNRANFADIVRMGRRMGVTVYVMTPEGCRPDSPTVQGWLLQTGNPGRQWLKTVLPAPHVVYNRIPTRKAEQRAAERETIRFLSSSERVHLFNPGFFDKWSLHLCLDQSSHLRSFLPETCRWGDEQKFRQMAAAYDTLYLKPVDGKAGNGMIRIRRTNRGHELIHQTISSCRVDRPPDRRSLLRRLHHLIQGREYVIQQGIPLARHQGRPFDLRLLLQKDGQGKWSKTGLGIRVAGQAAISTHVPMGGSIADAGQVLAELFGDEAPALMQKIEETGNRIASHIEEQQEGCLGEMSMDLGLEGDGRLWFFEANAKPMKFDEPEIRERSLKRLLQYSIFLSGFHPPVKKEA